MSICCIISKYIWTWGFYCRRCYKRCCKCTTFKLVTVNLSAPESYTIPASVASCPPVVVNTTLLASKEDVIEVMLVSFADTLVLSEELTSVNEPEIPAAVNGEANAPDISDAIWAELDNNPELFNVDIAEVFKSIDPVTEIFANSTQAPACAKYPLPVLYFYIR